MASTASIKEVPSSAYTSLSSLSRSTPIIIKDQGHYYNSTLPPKKHFTLSNKTTNQTTATMQPTILLLTLTTLAAAIPANTPRNPDNQMPAPPDISITDNHSPRARDNHSPAPPTDGDDYNTSENDNHSPRARAAEAEAAANRYHKWNAHGGCQTDWGGRCLNKCKAEAKDKGYKCDKVSDHIWKEECWLGWSVCTCYCSY